MSENNHFSNRLREPLNETTRKARRNLLATAVIGVVITKVGLVPEKISAFGVEFTSANQQALITLLIFAIIYFALSFAVYVYSELTAWQIVFSSQEIAALKEESKRETGLRFGTTPKELEEEKKFREHVRFLYFRSKPTFLLRLSVELVIPLIIGLYSCISLFTYEVKNETNVTMQTQEPANKALKQGASHGTAEKRAAP